MPLSSIVETITSAVTEEPECTKLLAFDMVEYVKAYVALSFRSYLSEGPNGIPSHTKCYPLVTTKEEAAKLEALVKWADCKDPCSKIRSAHCKAMWDNRAEGEKFVSVCKSLGIADI